MVMDYIVIEEFISQTNVLYFALLNACLHLLLLPN